MTSIISIGCTICGNDTPLHAHRSTFAARRIYRAPLSDTNETSFNYSYIVLQSKAVSAVRLFSDAPRRL